MEFLRKRCQNSLKEHEPNYPKRRKHNPKLLKKHLEYGDDEILWCGISLGYEDQEHPANSFRTEREQFDSFAKLLK